MKVLVTGGSGFIGTNLVESLTSAGHQVVSFDVQEPRNPAHRELWIAGDLCADGAVEAVDGETVGDYAANTRGVSAVIDAVNRLAPETPVVYASSRLVCKIGYQPTGDDDYCPPNPYGESKVVGEKLVRAEARHPWVIVRPSSIWGPWFGVPYRDFFDTVLGGRFPEIKGVEVRKSFGYVGNTVHELLAIQHAHRDLVGQTFYLADYPPIEVNSFAAEIRAAAGVRNPPRVPVSLLRPAARAGDLLKRVGVKEPKLTTFRLDNLLTPMVHDLDGLEKVAGSLPYSTAEGIRETLTWITAHG
jgi:nucleoside-diphosphate-sugar epimerase